MQENIAINEIDKRYVVFQSEEGFKVQKDFSSTTNFGLIKNKEACHKIRQHNIYCEEPTGEHINIALRVGKHDDASQNGFGLLHIQNKHNDLIDYFYEHFANNDSLSSHSKNREIKELIAEVINSLNTGGLAKQVVVAFSHQDQRFILAVEFSNNKVPLYIACVLYPTGPSLLEIITMYAISNVEFEEFKQAGQRNIPIYKQNYTVPKNTKSESKTNSNSVGNINTTNVSDNKVEGNNQANNDNNKEVSDVLANVNKKKKSKKKKKAKGTTAALLPRLTNDVNTQKDIVAKHKKELCTSFTELMLDNVYEMPKYSNHNSNKAYAPILKAHILLYGKLNKWGGELRRINKHLLKMYDDMSESITGCGLFCEKNGLLSEADFALFKNLKLSVKDHSRIVSDLKEARTEDKNLANEYDRIVELYWKFFQKMGVSSVVKGIFDKRKEVQADNTTKYENDVLKKYGQLMVVTGRCSDVNLDTFNQNRGAVNLLEQYNEVVLPATRNNMIKAMLSVLALINTADNVKNYYPVRKIVNRIYEELLKVDAQLFEQSGVATPDELTLLLKAQSHQCEALMEDLNRKEELSQDLFQYKH